jgi:acetylornithine deacetylase/succinyl-diaminopimelate desuccinylase family protein
MTATQKLLRDLVAFPSVNPAFLPAGDRRAGEQRVAGFLGSTASKAGLSVSFQKAGGRANVLVKLTPREKVRRRVLLAPHMDTVGAADNQFTPRIRHGRLYGRGACDTKGSIAAMLGAVLELAQSGDRPAATEIIFAGLVDEENAQAGSRALAASGLKADLAIVGEPTRLKLVSAHKGSLWLKLETRGKAAHGSRPELGVNAVHAMSLVVDFLETRYASWLSRRHHPLLGCATISVGVISGGTQPNIVPDYCSIQVDRRTLPSETEQDVIREMNGLLRHHGLKAEVISGKLDPCPPMETNPHHPLVLQFLRILRQHKSAGVDYFCDAAILSQAGIPSVVFGPGDIAQAHTADEWISLKSLDLAQKRLLAFLRSLN